MPRHDDGAAGHHHCSSRDQSIGEPGSHGLTEVDGTTVGAGDGQGFGFGQSQSTVAGRVVDVIGEDDLESVETEALPHLDGRKGEESDRLIEFRFCLLLAAMIFGNASGNGNLGFRHDFLGMLGALTSRFSRTNNRRIRRRRACGYDVLSLVTPLHLFQQSF